MQVADWRRGETLISRRADRRFARSGHRLAVERPEGVLQCRSRRPRTSRSFTAATAPPPSRRISPRITRSPPKPCVFPRRIRRLHQSVSGAAGLIKRLPGDGERRSIMMISSGIDYFRGNLSRRVRISIRPSSAHRKRTSTSGRFTLRMQAMAAADCSAFQRAVEAEPGSRKKPAPNRIISDSASPVTLKQLLRRDLESSQQPVLAHV